MKFSIIIPARNEEATIGRCLDSIAFLEWDRSDYEVIVVDNGSHDLTAVIAHGKDARVVVRPGLTISALRNCGAHIAQGETLVFLDADCTVEKNWLRKAAKYIPQNDVVCFGSPPIVTEDATWVQKAWFLVRGKKGQVIDVEWLESMNMFVRRVEFENVSGFDETMVTCEDYDLCLRLRESGRIVSDPEIVATHHGESASLTHFFKKEYWRGTSNLYGFRRHGFSWNELPSVAFPIVYGLLAMLTIVLMAAAALTQQDSLSGATLLLLIVWQSPLFILAISKNGGAFRFMRSIQLYLLLNVYFLARGGAVLQRHQ
jgi:glycosyltransferase involved in cell wall biosynthesis